MVAEHINVWVEENSTELHRDVALKAGVSAGWVLATIIRPVDSVPRPITIKHCMVVKMSIMGCATRRLHRLITKQQQRPLAPRSTPKKQHLSPIITYQHDTQTPQPIGGLLPSFAGIPPSVQPIGP